MDILRIAWRNLNLHRRRNILTGIVIAAATAAVALATGFTASMRKQIIEGSVAVQTGEARVFRGPVTEVETFYPVYEEPKWEWRIDLQSSIWNDLTADPRVKAWCPRIKFAAMLTGTSPPIALQVTAIDPSRENQLFNILPPKAGKIISNDNPYGIYLSQAYARALKVQPGDIVVLTANSRYRQLNTATLAVAGVFQKSAPWYEYSAYVPLAAAQELLELDREAMDVNILLYRHADLKGFVQDWKDRISKHLPSGHVQTWQESAGILTSVVLSNLAGSAIFNLILLFVVATIVNNTVVLTLSERTREIGMIKAMGMTHYKLWGLYFTEYLILTATAAVIGAAVGELLLAIGSHGIEIHQYEALCWAVGGNSIRLEPSIGSFAISIAFVISFSLAASIYPIKKSVSLSPVDALR